MFGNTSRILSKMILERKLEGVKTARERNAIRREHRKQDLNNFFWSLSFTILILIISTGIALIIEVVL